MAELRVAADTSLGVVWTNMRTVNKTGGFIVTDKLVEKVAEKHGLPVSEVYELVAIEKDGKPFGLPRPPHHPASRPPIPFSPKPRIGLVHYLAVSGRAGPHPGDAK